jgi:hypothetical protein
MTQELLELSAENIRLKAQIIRKDQRIQEQADKIKEMENEAVDFAIVAICKPEQFRYKNIKDVYKNYKLVYEKNRESSI